MAVGRITVPIFEVISHMEKRSANSHRSGQNIFSKKDITKQIRPAPGIFITKKI